MPIWEALKCEGRQKVGSPLARQDPCRSAWGFPGMSSLSLLSVSGRRKRRRRFLLEDDDKHRDGAAVPRIGSREPLSKSDLSGFQPAGQLQGPAIGPEPAGAVESGVWPAGPGPVWVGPCVGRPLCGSAPPPRRPIGGACYLR